MHTIAADYTTWVRIEEQTTWRDGHSQVTRILSYRTRKQTVPVGAHTRIGLSPFKDPWSELVLQVAAGALFTIGPFVALWVSAAHHPHATAAHIITTTFALLYGPFLWVLVRAPVRWHRIAGARAAAEPAAQAAHQRARYCSYCVPCSSPPNTRRAGACGRD
ncbi:hypothetical protein [Streptacidiphilus sp. PAMC 29251]